MAEGLTAYESSQFDINQCVAAAAAAAAVERMVE
jgi:hypothetical protein